MYKDKILAEVWRNRDEYAKKHHHNLDEIVLDLQQQERGVVRDVVKYSKNNRRRDRGVTLSKFALH
jgi:hypothetical protein